MRRPVTRAKRSTIARGRARVLVHVYGLPHVQATATSAPQPLQPSRAVRAHGDKSPPVAWARLASFSAYSSSSLSGEQHHFLHHAVGMAVRVSRIVAATHGEHFQILSLLHKIKHTCDHPFLHRAKRSKLARGRARAMIA